MMLPTHPRAELRSLPTVQLGSPEGPPVTCSHTVILICSVAKYNVRTVSNCAKSEYPGPRSTGNLAHDEPDAMKLLHLSQGALHDFFVAQGRQPPASGPASAGSTLGDSGILLASSPKP